ncbi:MAG TPA: 3-hydroxyacyl-CoA dehydrogenase/enoyl-CoA hydratase family protein [Terriglobia bacterium]|nr:3-hydroxyacyl-CoA dehydrogenase/enoyl-CoA hydratase family protein [Terriglobia bacterium]
MSLIREVMVREIRRVAVLGAGTMGARIAAHLANASIPVVLLDMVPKELTAEEQSRGLSTSDPRVRNRLATAGLDAALKSKPAAFFIPEAARLIAPGNFEDDLGLVRDCDWIIEAVTEDRAIKQSLLKRVETLRAPGAVVSSNTSGISIAGIAEGFGDDFQRHWLGTHFFNPPRYMKLLEVIPTQNTLPEVVEAVSRFGDVVLGKGIVIAKDSPNFIANRIGTFVTLNVLHIMQQDGYTIEEIDALTGPAMGLPRSATFRTLDLVGLDVLAHVIENLRRSLPNDERHELFEAPGFVAEMRKRELLGDKTRQGFYKKVKAATGSGDDSEIRTLDLATFEYRSRQKPSLGSLEMARNIEDVRQRVNILMQAQDRAGEFYRTVLSDTFHYAAMRIPEIADDIVAVDNGMKWGFNWEAGPFELWDAVGVEKLVSRWGHEQRLIPPVAEQLLGKGHKTFYCEDGGRPRYFEFGKASYLPVPQRDGVIILPSLTAQSKEVRRNAGASLIDLGDGVLCLEFHSKMNTIGADTVAMIHAGLKALNENFDAMVIGNQAPNFCVGANLMLLLIGIHEGEWEEIHEAVRAFQGANMALKYAEKPVVAAPFGLTLGGGTEICLHCARVQAAAESYMGLVEAGVGLLPAGGGTKEMLLRAMDALPKDPEANPFIAVKEVFETVGMAKVSTSAAEARKLGYLSERDSVSMNRDRLIAEAKLAALDLRRRGYRPGTPREDVPALGQPAFAKMKLGLHLMRRAEYISDYDVVVGTELARVLSGGGEFTSPQRVSESYLLDLEREAFVRLCGHKNTVERIQHMLKYGKPLRN